MIRGKIQQHPNARTAYWMGQQKFIDLNAIKISNMKIYLSLALSRERNSSGAHFNVSNRCSLIRTPTKNVFCPPHCIYVLKWGKFLWIVYLVFFFLSLFFFFLNWTVVDEYDLCFVSIHIKILRQRAQFNEMLDSIEKFNGLNKINDYFHLNFCLSSDCGLAKLLASKYLAIIIATARERERAVGILQTMY